MLVVLWRKQKLKEEGGPTCTTNHPRTHRTQGTHAAKGYEPKEICFEVEHTQHAAPSVNRFEATLSRQLLPFVEARVLPHHALLLHFRFVLSCLAEKVLHTSLFSRK